MPVHALPIRWSNRLFSWPTLGVVVAALMLARWTWILFAPATAAVPATTAWEQMPTDVPLFGAVADTTSGSNLGNVQLVGVFAHPTRGFAVLLVEGKQRGVGLGGEVMPGARLMATAADHVVLEQGGVKTRIPLVQNAAAGATVAPASAETVLSPAKIATTTAPAPQAATPAVNDGLSGLTPEQRNGINQELQHFRRRF